MGSIIIEIPTEVSSFSYAGGSDFSYPVRFHQVIDLDSDGIEEIIFAGFETQFNTPENYTNTKVSIFGWSENTFQNITSQWLPNGIDLVEAVGDISVGDFNGDGLLDVYLSGNADMDYSVNSYALINRGSYFDRQMLGPTQWEHDSAVGDINQDGYDDVVVVGYLHPSVFYLGSPSGLMKYVVPDGFGFNSYETFASGVALGDFFGDGSVSVVVTDAATAGSTQDIHLLSVVFDDQNMPLGFRYAATLPTPRLILLNDPNLNSHDIRAETLDFNRDGLDDVIIFSYVFSYIYGGADLLSHKSEIQFLQNLGGGVFIDVTDLYRSGYDVRGFVGYNPQIQDFNGDGLIDIFSSNADYFSEHYSTTLLLSDANGIFQDTAKDAWSTMLRGDNASQMSLIQGPSDQLYAVIEGVREYGGISYIGLSKIRFEEDGNGIQLLPEPAAHYFLPSTALESIGLTPDGLYLLIKVGGALTLVPRGEYVSFSDQSLSTTDLTQTIAPIPVFKSTGGVGGFTLPELYTGPASLGLKYQLIETADNAVVIGSTDNDFIKVASTNSVGKAVNGGGGNDVIDGGVGSTFVTGGGSSANSSTYFLDGRAPGTSWSTITDFKLDVDKATIWGFVRGVSSVDTSFTNFNNAGAAGYEGLTLHFKNLLPSGETSGTNPNLNSITLTGRTLQEFGASSLAELNAQINAGTNPNFLVGATQDHLGTHGYLFIH